MAIPFKLRFFLVFKIRQCQEAAFEPLTTSLLIYAYGFWLFFWKQVLVIVLNPTPLLPLKRIPLPPSPSPIHEIRLCAIYENILFVFE